MSELPPPIPSDPGGQSPPPPYTPPTMAGPLMAGMAPHRGGLVLGLGIGSLAVWFLTAIGAIVLPCCGASWLLSVGMAIPAWVMANADLAAMNAGRMDPLGRSSTQAGKVCAIISTIIHLLGLIALLVFAFFVIVIGAAAAGAAAGSHP